MKAYQFIADAMGTLATDYAEEGTQQRKKVHLLIAGIVASNNTQQTIQALACDTILNKAYHWICEQRKNLSHNNSIWDLRFNWKQVKPQIQHQLLSNVFQLSPLQSHTIDGQMLSSWTAIDAYHYYESINHEALMPALATQISCKGLLYCQSVEIREGDYYHFTQGITKGCPLSPFIAAIYLKPLDDAMHKHGFYVWIMDDRLVMVKTKQQLCKIIKLTHRILNQLKLKMHPDKTFIGCIKKGFDFLGIHFGEAPEISKTSLENHRSKIAQRYAQGASDACIGNYIKRWTSWCMGLLKCCTNKLNLDASMPCNAQRECFSWEFNMETNHDEIYWTKEKLTTN